MKDKGIYHNVRCSMHNKQHVYVHKVLTDLNLSIYKSKNQFIIDAVEHYAKSLNQEDLTNTAAEQYIREGQARCDRDTDTEAMKKKIVNEVTVAVQTNVISVLMTELAKLKLGIGSRQKVIEDDDYDEFEEENELDIPDSFRDVVMGLAGMEE